ncbi:kinase-like domain-containing protein [Syncephalis fuscata]|nr:kinase-like domain-containing protein [Syncephalis fuscata]
MRRTHPYSVACAAIYLFSLFSCAIALKDEPSPIPQLEKTPIFQDIRLEKYDKREWKQIYNDGMSIFLPVKNGYRYTLCYPGGAGKELVDQAIKITNLADSQESMYKFSKFKPSIRLIPTVNSLSTANGYHCIVYPSHKSVRYTLRNFSFSQAKIERLYWLGEVMRKLIAGIAYLHSIDVRHTAIMPSNILISHPDDPSRQASPSVILVGFEYAMVSKGKAKPTFERMAYSPPETAYEEVYDLQKYDLWQLGAIIYEFTTGHSPYGHDGTTKKPYGREEYPKIKERLRKAYIMGENSCPKLKISINDSYMFPPVLGLMDNLLRSRPIFRKTSFEIYETNIQYWRKFAYTTDYSRLPT